MAITFVPRDKKKTLFRSIITIFLVLILFITPFLIFSPLFTGQSKDIFIEEVNRPDIGIDFSIIDSDEVKNLETFLVPQIEFSYKALDKNNKQVTGRIFANDENDAKNNLSNSGFKNINLEEVNIGKKEPFVPYY